MTIEETQRAALVDLNGALAAALREKEETRAAAEAFQVTAQGLARELGQLRQENDAIKGALTDALDRAASQERVTRALRLLHEATVNDRNHLAARVAEAEMALDRETQARPWWAWWRAG